jgi:anti-sigma regulatory factor (Ser/Thr protein kinase)
MARVFLGQTVQAWRLAEDCAGTAKLIVSELATNAVKHTGRVDGPPTPAPAEHLALIYVHVELHDEALHIAVWDNATAAPAVQKQTTDADGGRGLFIVDTLASEWGHYFPSSGGKVVWADVLLTANHAPLATSEPTINRAPTERMRRLRQEPAKARLQQ